MRMVVVLPLPLGPRKPKISPRRHLESRSWTTALVAEALVQPADVDGQRRRRGHRATWTSSGWPGWRDCSADERASTMNTSLLRLAGVDDGRRVLGLGRDVAHLRLEGAGAAVATHAHRSADADGGQLRFRDEEADPERTLGEKREHRGAGRDHLAGAVVGVHHPAGRGRGGRPLLELPLGGGQRGAGHLGRRALGLESPVPGRPRSGDS